MMLLHQLYCKYDMLCEQYGVYKVEPIGDCYVACTGLLQHDAEHAAQLVAFGEAMIQVGR
jgi:hypothetical protein